MMGHSVGSGLGRPPPLFTGFELQIMLLIIGRTALDKSSCFVLNRELLIIFFFSKKNSLSYSVSIKQYSTLHYRIFYLILVCDKKNCCKYEKMTTKFFGSGCGTFSRAVAYNSIHRVDGTTRIRTRGRRSYGTDLWPRLKTVCCHLGHPKQSFLCS